MSASLGRSREKSCPYRVSVLHQTLIVSTQADQEKDTRHVLETMNPLPSLALLTTHVDHQHFVISKCEARFCNADCPCSALEYVLLVRNVVGLEKAFQVSEVIAQAVRDACERSSQSKQARWRRGGINTRTGADGPVLTCLGGLLRSPLNRLPGRRHLPIEP